MIYEGPHTEEERVKLVDQFYKANPGGLACDYCVKKIDEETADRSSRLYGLRICGYCLAIILTRGEA